MPSSRAIHIGTGGNGQAYGQPQIERELVIAPPGRHAVFPQLISVDSLAGSDALTDTPAILRYTTAVADFSANEIIEEWAQPIYSGLAGTPVLIETWSLWNTFPGTFNCSGASCFAGDYRYGAFYTKVGDTLSFFTPWTGEKDHPPGSPIPGIRAKTGFVSVTP